jgi:hypothetical protein
MKKYLLLVFLLAFTVSIFAQHSNYSKVKVYADLEQLQLLAQNGIDVTEGVLKKNVSLTTDLSESEILLVEAAGLNYEILIEDVSKFYREQNIGKSTNVNDYKGTSEWEVPEDFDFGSMGGHCTFDEVVAHLDNMIAKYPNLITDKESIGTTIEGRDIWMVKISDNPNVNEDEPEVLYTSLHHAREPAGLMQNLYYMYYLLENYETSELVQDIVNSRELYFIPVINADGYAYNQQIEPGGGGMWRKNRRDNGGGSYGVDPNRNYGFMWGLDNSGSSPDPWDETYRGTEAFSEPEVAAMRDICEANDFKICLNYHTHGNYLLYTWGWTADPCEDDAIYEAFSIQMTQDNNYTWGAGGPTLYPTNGGSDDWMYGEQTTKGKIFAYTPELGGGSDGFWCPIDRIIPIAQENMIQNILAAYFAGVYASVEENSPTIVNETEGYIYYDIQRLGLIEGSGFEVNLQPISPEIFATGANNSYTSMEMLEIVSDSISYTLDPAITGGTPLQFLLSVNIGDVVFSDTIHKIFGEPIVIFEDDGNSLINWTSSQWDNTTSNYHSATASITDSPFGDYDNNENSSITMINEIDLTTAGYALLSFWGNWEIEAGWDYVQLLASTNGGSSWEPVEGNYTVTGNSNQATGEPLYDGFQSWVMEEIDLSDYLGASVKFRFELISDNYVTEDGFYFDDFTVTVIDIVSGEESYSAINHEFIISNPIPNPAIDIVSFNYKIDDNQEGVNIQVFNITGQEVYNGILDVNKSSISIPVNTWESGLYLYKVSGNGIELTKKFLKK